jgi:hypothetical protein
MTATTTTARPGLSLRKQSLRIVLLPAPRGGVRRRGRSDRSGSPDCTRRVSTEFSLAALSGGCFCDIGGHDSIFLRPFAPSALPGFFATMDALTPARRLFVPALRHMNTSWSRAGLPALRVWSSEHSIPNHLARPRHRFSTQPLSVTGFRRCRSGLRLFASRLAARPGRIGFVSLRTARSPPVALHLASWRRSYVRLQAGVCVPEEDFHLSDQTRLQAHWRHVFNVPICRKMQYFDTLKTCRHSLSEQSLTEKMNQSYAGKRQFLL